MGILKQQEERIEHLLKLRDLQDRETKRIIMGLSLSFRGHFRMKELYLLQKDMESEAVLTALII